ncbi:energy transducer TonB [Cognatiluteimonas weifangensis]|uniref:Protein TonB n=1 Tax=Cognatiluteimonas weifangensis TaxID=2303539 RepID=A0A372DPC8_9GAMM|nr:energy transducer TonB [Luteimonas weifangensis]RFP61428.1 energy transducer TonB [Luteimonas weifangensis]
MFVATALQARPARFRFVAVLAVLCAFAGCKKDQTATPETGPATTATEGVVAPAVSDKVSAMSVDQLREAAGTALREQRLYAPAGNSAMEYYLALRDKQPNDPAVSSALTDLMPYALIATEQSIGRDDFSEAQRLYALMEKTDAKAPALPRLKQAIADGQASLAQRAQQEQLQSEEEAKRRAELEKQRAADQQKAQQEAAQRLAAQQAADQRAAAEREAAERAAQAQRAAQQAAPPPAAAAPAPAAPRVSNTLRPISTPAPSYPREAQRRGRSGEVEVEFTVGTDGTVTSARVVRASPPRIFDREALSAVNRWRFQPVGSAVTTRRTIQFKPAE